MYYIAVICGAYIAILFNFNEALAKDEFRFSIFLRQNLGSTLLNVICVCVLVFAKDDIQDIYPLSFISSVILGMSGQFIFKKIAKIFNKSDETFIGLNNNK